MIKMIATLGGKKTLFLGLERLNTEKMHDGKPIRVDVAELIEGFEDKDAFDEVIVWAGETLEDAYNELREAIPDLPPYEETLDISGGN